MMPTSRTKDTKVRQRIGTKLLPSDIDLVESVVVEEMDRGIAVAFQTARATNGTSTYTVVDTTRGPDGEASSYYWRQDSYVLPPRPEQDRLAQLSSRDD